MAFLNRIRIPLHLTRPQFPSTRDIFPLADGSVRVQSIVLKKVYEMESDYLPEVIHERLVVALSHDTVNIEGDKYLGGVSLDAEYEIDWQAFLDLPVAKSSAKLRVTPFDATNSNCQTCDNMSQLDLVDDTYPDPVDEGDTFTLNVFTNDSIACYPITATIQTFNTDYVDSVTIDPDGTVEIVLKATTPSGANVNLLTYRVTCPDGTYDEADVFAEVVGSIVVCEPVTDITGTADQDSIPLSWTPPSSPPPLYRWELYECSNPGTPVQTGTTASPSVNITGLSAATCYWFYVRSECDVDDFSAYLGAQFTTAAPPGSGNCGLYRATWNDGSGDVTHVNALTYLTCAGNYFTIPIYNMVDRIICAAQHSAGDPVDIVGATAVIYIEPC